MRKYRTEPPSDIEQRYNELRKKPAHSLSMEERKFLTDYLDVYGYLKLDKNCKDCYWWESGLPAGNPYGFGAVKCKIQGWLPQEIKGCHDFLLDDSNL